VSLPERPPRAPLGPARVLSALLIAAAATLALGCGKANLHQTSAQSRTPRHASPHGHPSPPAAAERVPVPLTITPARAERFARAVTLTTADLPGSSPTPPHGSSVAREKEAAKCGGHPTVAIGGGQSPEFARGQGLDHESLSSSVEVLADAKSVHSDLGYTESHAGLTCYAKILSKSLQEGHGSDSHIRLLGVHLRKLQVTLAPGRVAVGIRIIARVGLVGSRLAVGLYVDALSLPYGPAELDLYTTSFVQPVPLRTQQELLTLMRARALLHRL
jgi:hypothetical protein